jgi:hypothetical protein
MAEEEQLPRLRETLVGDMLGLLLVAVVSMVAVLVLFDWSATDLALFVPVAVVFFGIPFFVLVTRRMVPRGPLPQPPPGVRSRRERRWRRAVWHTLSIPLAVGLAWLADAWNEDPLFVPGMWIGFAVAEAAALVLVVRWESRHRQRVVVGETEDSDPMLYARGRPDS